jgi:hypothetical protein
LSTLLRSVTDLLRATNRHLLPIAETAGKTNKLKTALVETYKA